LVHDEDAVAHLHGFVLIGCDEYGCEAELMLKALEPRTSAFAQFRVEV
jgi:hypothetical protein